VPASKYRGAIEPLPASSWSVMKSCTTASCSLSLLLGTYLASSEANSYHAFVRSEKSQWRL